jgi:hypothetical protein
MWSEFNINHFARSTVIQSLLAAKDDSAYAYSVSDIFRPPTRYPFRKMFETVSIKK